MKLALFREIRSNTYDCLWVKFTLDWFIHSSHSLPPRSFESKEIRTMNESNESNYWFNRSVTFFWGTSKITKKLKNYLLLLFFFVDSWRFSIVLCFHYSKQRQRVGMCDCFYETPERASHGRLVHFKKCTGTVVWYQANGYNRRLLVEWWEPRNLTK